MSRFWDLLRRMQSAGKLANVRLAIVAVVLGVGGFAVYQGVKQLGPADPAPKKVAKNPDEKAPVAAATGSEGGVTGASEQQPAGGPGAEAQYQPAAEAPLYGPGATTEESSGSAYGAGGKVAKTGGAQVYGAAQYSTEQPAAEAAAEEATAAPNRLRPPTRSGGVYALSDETPASEQPAASEETSPAAESTLIQEVPATESAATADQPSAAGSPPSTRPPTTFGSPRSNPLPSTRTFVGGSRTEATESESATERPPVRPNTLPGAKPGFAASTAFDHGGRNVGAPVSHTQATTHGVPGERQLEGMQAPSVALEKLAPAEVQVGKLATFETHVRNVGQIVAHDVIVTDHVPRGTRLEATTPQATEAADGTLTWNLGTMQPGEETSISMQVTPETEGEIGSVAQVGFAGHATARTISTRPLLKIEHTAPKQVMIGQEVRLQVTITNPGSGAATGVIVEEDVPDGLSHVAGNELEYEIGVLRPGESRQLELSLKAEKPGVVENVILVRGEGNLTSQHKVPIEVISPQLQVGVNGPKKRFLDRQATYTVTVANPGTAAARGVQLIAYLPKGMKYVSSDSEGQYDATQHAVLWGLEELPASKSGNVKLTMLPLETGDQRIRVEGKADLGLSVSSEQAVQVDAASGLVFSISDLADPIEVGTDTTYEVRVANKGSRPATNVRLAAALPNEMKLTSGEGPSKATTRGQQIGFEPIGRINPGEEVSFRIHAQGLRPGDHLIRVQLSSDESPTPVTKEESTQVYVDR